MANIQQQNDRNLTMWLYLISEYLEEDFKMASKSLLHHFLPFNSIHAFSLITKCCLVKRKYYGYQHSEIHSSVAVLLNGSSQPRPIVLILSILWKSVSKPHPKGRNLLLKSKITMEQLLKEILSSLPIQILKSTLQELNLPLSNGFNHHSFFK